MKQNFIAICIVLLAVSCSEDSGKDFPTPSQSEFKVPLAYVAEHNLAGGSQYGSRPVDPSRVTSAQTDADLRWAAGHNNNESGYYNWYVLKGITDNTYNPNGKNLFGDPFFTTGKGKGYHLPSRWEWTGVVSYDDQVRCSESINESNVNEAIEFGKTKKTFASDYYSTGDGICYALRFKRATGNPNDGSSISDFPLATDNSMLCAYRYTFAEGNNLDSRLQIDCVYLGDKGASMSVSTISNGAWWTSRASETTTRIFPAAGYLSSAIVSGSSVLNGRSSYGIYWSGTEYKDSGARYAYFESKYAGADSHYDKYSGLAVRLFSSE